MSTFHNVRLFVCVPVSLCVGVAVCAIAKYPFQEVKVLST